MLLVVAEICQSSAVCVAVIAQLRVPSFTLVCAYLQQASQTAALTQLTVRCFIVTDRRFVVHTFCACRNASSTSSCCNSSSRTTESKCIRQMCVNIRPNLRAVHHNCHVLLDLRAAVCCCTTCTPRAVPSQSGENVGQLNDTRITT